MHKILIPRARMRIVHDSDQTVCAKGQPACNWFLRWKGSSAFSNAIVVNHSVDVPVMPLSEQGL